MTYTQIACAAVVLVLGFDLAIVRTALVRRRVFWVSYAIIVFFQLITNGILTGIGMVKYRDFAILGSDSPQSGSPPFIGDGRLAFAPVEDILFGFAIVLLTLSMWVWLGRRGIQRNPFAGPPRDVMKRVLGNDGDGR
ncbi:MAG: lycopene cyclase domain-containing protein [Actinobacteria bacterium]|uniref:Unannotated protein n=1 Tax=freshwater metagenome TaxID=449393 RepID=A0A6J5Z5M6_9ZZZZ|nr:lycopene cyclase domain-containing protein [Actinomycetota bacterium]